MGPHVPKHRGSADAASIRSSKGYLEQHRKPNNFFVCKASLGPRVYTVNQQTLRGTSAAGAGVAACCSAGKGDQRRSLSFPPGGAGLPTKANRFGPAHVSRCRIGNWPGYPAPLPSSPSLPDFGQTAIGWRTHLAARRVAVCLVDPCSPSRSTSSSSAGRWPSRGSSLSLWPPPPPWPS